MRGLHVAYPFARAAHVLLGQPAMVAQYVLDDRVDAALQPVRGARHRTALQQFRLEIGEQPALAEQPLQPPVAASQLLVRPPPPAPRRLGVGRVVARVGAFGDEVLPPFVPRVEGLAPPDGLPGRLDRGEPVGQPLQLAAGLEPGPGRQVRPRVALHVHQAALDPRSRPRLRARRLRAAQPVGDEHVRRGKPGEQGQVCGLGLVRAPLPVQHLAGLPVDGDDQAPAVAHVRAVRHDRVAPGVRRGDARADAPAPCDSFAQGAGVARGVRRPLG